MEDYAFRWLEGRKNWPQGTEFWWYTEGYDRPEGTQGKDFSEMREFSEWKAKHAGYKPPDWQRNVVGFSHKVFAAIDALYDYDGVGVWLDADCVTYAPIPEGLVEEQVKEAYLACYMRTGLYTETGMWIVDCRHRTHRAFMDYWRNIYLADKYTVLTQWHDCMTLDATIRAFADHIAVNNLSGEHSRDPHPQAKTEFGKYIDHCKGPRKASGISPENKHHRKAA